MLAITIIYWHVFDLRLGAKNLMNIYICIHSFQNNLRFIVLTPHNKGEATEWNIQ